ncbi:MAG: tetratricopeptide repeat protein [Planctomycetota bacterium]
MAPFGIWAHKLWRKDGMYRKQGGALITENGGEIMTGLGKFAIQVGLAFLVCALLFSGCNSEKTQELKEVEMTPAEKERAELLKRIDRKFENPGAHYELGRLYQADGLWSQAEHQYSITLSFDPTHREAQAARVNVLLASGDTVKAELLADEYMEQASVSAAGSLRLALAFQRQGMDERALACYQQALRLAPNSAKINRQIGYYYLSKNDKERARDYLTRSFQLNSNQPEVAGELGRLGVGVKIPRKTEGGKKLDKIVEESDRNTQTQ